MIRCSKILFSQTRLYLRKLIWYRFWFAYIDDQSIRATSVQGPPSVTWTWLTMLSYSSPSHILQPAGWLEFPTYLVSKGDSIHLLEASSQHFGDGPKPPRGVCFLNSSPKFVCMTILTFCSLKREQAIVPSLFYEITGDKGNLSSSLRHTSALRIFPSNGLPWWLQHWSTSQRAPEFAPRW